MGRKGGPEPGSGESNSAALGSSWGLPHSDRSAEGCLPPCTKSATYCTQEVKLPETRIRGCTHRCSLLATVGNWGWGALDCGVPPERPASTSVFPQGAQRFGEPAQGHLVGPHGARQPLPGPHHCPAGRRVQACRLWRSPGPHRVPPRGLGPAESNPTPTSAQGARPVLVSARPGPQVSPC